MAREIVVTEANIRSMARLAWTLLDLERACQLKNDLTVERSYSFQFDVIMQTIGYMINGDLDHQEIRGLHLNQVKVGFVDAMVEMILEKN